MQLTFGFFESHDGNEEEVSVTRPTFRVQVLPGGSLPAQAHPGVDRGYDVTARAIVDPSMGYEKDGMTRCTLFNFRAPVKKHPNIVEVASGKGKRKRYAWVLPPGKDVWLGLGFALELHMGWCAYAVARSSTDRAGIVVSNDHVPIDPGFRGEPVAHLWNWGERPFHIIEGQRLVQLVFERREQVTLEPLGKGQRLLPVGERRNGSHGSTGR